MTAVPWRSCLESLARYRYSVPLSSLLFSIKATKHERLSFVYFVFEFFCNQKKTDAGAFLGTVLFSPPQQHHISEKHCFFVFVHFLFFSLTPVCCELNFFAWSHTASFPGCAGKMTGECWWLRDATEPAHSLSASQNPKIYSALILFIVFTLYCCCWVGK